VTSTELHVPVGRQVEFEFTSIDVITPLWVPEWRIKKDAVTGMTTSVVATPDRQGPYQAICAELCGIGHATMRAPVVVESEDFFERWLDEDGRNGPRGRAQRQLTARTMRLRHCGSPPARAMHWRGDGSVMDGSSLMTVAMIVMMVVMMGGMIGGGVWALVRRRGKRDR
jgi:heme/copper-type cytochrome/quinol oxidase subunit 2